MDNVTLEYIKSIKPTPRYSGKELLEEGRKIGNSFKAGRGKFIQKNSDKYSCWMDYKKECAKSGKLIWMILIGLATLEDECDAFRKLREFSDRTGLELNLVQAIPSCNVGIPKECRDSVPDTTSFMLDGWEDYQKMQDAATFDLSLIDHHLFVPNAIETTINALKLGCSRVGSFTQFSWGYQGFSDEVKRCEDTVRALGIMASKKDEMFSVESYLDDGFPGYFMDCSSYVGFSLLEKYILEDLCGVNYTISYGGLLSDGAPRLAIAVALHKLLSTDEKLVISYVNSSTNLQWDHDIHGNYGVSCQEFLLAMLVEKHYKMGMGLNPVSITEKVAVPTLQDLLDIFAAGKRVEEKVGDWDIFMDFTAFDEIVDVMMREGKILFENALSSMKAAGINIEDPLEMILLLKDFNPVQFERLFHSTTFGKENKEVKPFYPTVLGRQTVAMTDEIMEQLREEGLEGSLEGKSVVVASADAHSYGLLLVSNVLSAMGASVVNGGVSMDAPELLDLADEEGIGYVAVSCHNGQALDYGKQLLALAEKRGKEYCFIMGGKMNAILEGHSEPIEVDHMLREIGVNANNDLRKTVKIIRDTNF